MEEPVFDLTKQIQAERPVAQECAHCGLPLPLQSYGKFDHTRFCCGGCEAVFTLINTCGLEHFYTHRQSLDKKLTPVATNRAQYDHYDDVLWIEKNCRTEGTVTVVSFLVKTIHCAACIWLLERLSIIAPGVYRAEPSLADSSVQVYFDAEKITPGGIARALQSLGYAPIGTHESSGAERFKEDRAALLRLGVAGFASGNIMLLAIALYEGAFSGISESFRVIFQWISLGLALPVIFYSAVPFYRTALGGLRIGVVHVDLPIAVGILVGFIASAYATIRGTGHVYFDSICTLIFFLLVGRWIQQRLLIKARRSIQNNTYLTDSIMVEDSTGRSRRLIDRVAIGEVAVIESTSVIPCDGVLLDAEGLVSNAHLTGEHTPVHVTEGDILFAGGVVISDTLRIRITALGVETRLGSLIKSVERQSAGRVPYRQLTQRLSKNFMLVVLIASTITWFLWREAGGVIAIEHIVALLVVSCPCALGLSAPLAAGIAAARAIKQGVFIKSGDVFERLAAVKHIVLDKTGTITKGDCTVRRYHILPITGVNEHTIGAVLHALERESTHPIGIALKNFSKKFLNNNSAPHNSFDSVSICSGNGVSGKQVDGTVWRVGKVAWALSDSALGMTSEAQEFLDTSRHEGLTPVALMFNRTPCAFFAIGDEIYAGIDLFIQQLTARGLSVSLLSGDEEAAVRHIAARVHIPDEQVVFDATPEDKAIILAEWQKKGPLVMVGDGINDMPAFAVADASIAVRGEVEACLKNADIFVPSGRMDLLESCFSGSSHTMRIIKRNLLFSLTYNALGIGLAMAGMITPLLAAVLMPLSSLAIIVSSSINTAFQDPATAQQVLNKTMD